MAELLQPKGIFSGEHLPKDWVGQKSDLEAYLQPLSDICPGMRVVSQISRGSNKTTFVLKSLEGLRVCQFTSSPSPEASSDANSVFAAPERMDYLRSNGIAVPKILLSGETYVGKEPHRYIVMDFVRGINADIFLARHPNKSQEVYYKFGEILARLQEVPFKEKQGSANEYVLGKVRYTGNFLIQNQVFSLEHIRQLIGVLERRLSLLGDPQLSYVHLDPFPVNLQITGNFNNFYVTLMDIEAIKGGHPLVEGLGRALKWGIYDWDYISGKLPYNASSTVNAFLQGYSKFSPDAIPYMQSSADLELLIETTELVSLPESILKESEKEEPAEYYEWSKSRLLQLIEKQ
jgi:aminoglycoside phosphotransferase (APT) family kinase protein